MSSTACIKLSKEQHEFLNFLEEEFKDRYTEHDEEFKSVLNEVLPRPPIVENFREFRQFDDRYSNDRNDRDRERYRHSNHDDDGRYSHSSKYMYRHRNHNNFSTPY